TYSSNFPVTLGAYQTIGGGDSDAFVTKIDASGDALLYSTLVGGSGHDDARGIAVDQAGNAYVTGYTTSTNFPTLNAAQASNGGGQDAFVSKLNASGSALVYSTYLGAAGDDF